MKRLLSWILALALVLGACALAEQWVVELIPMDAIEVQSLNQDAVAVDTPLEPDGEEGAEVELSEEELSDEWWNILLLGCDSYTKNSYSRTDSMIIVSVNAAQEQVKLTSLMRDTWIKVPGKSSHRKLTELCAVGGPQLTIDAINESFGMDIEDYALVSLEGMAEVIDLLGGIKLDVTEAERKALNKGLFDLSPYSGMEQLKESGEQVQLNGNQAVAFARIRKIDSDFVRTERQRTVLVTMAKKLKDGADLSTLMSLVSSLANYVDTNLGLLELMSLAKIGLRADLENVEELRLPADGTYDAGTFDGIWCIKPNYTKNKKILHEFIYG